MAYKVLILGASYGSLLGMKLLMANHDVLLVCRQKTAELINKKGTVIRIKIKGEEEYRTINSRDLPGKLVAFPPEEIMNNSYDLVCLAMQEPQYAHHNIRTALMNIAEAKVPCLSIMNMPPLAFLKRLSRLDISNLSRAYTDPAIWDRFDPSFVTLCSPDPQAYRPPKEAINFLHVGLATNFKAALFGDASANIILKKLEEDIDSISYDGQDIPVKLRVFESVYVPLAKWSMLLTGNYRCVTRKAPRTISDVVNDDLKKSRLIYDFVTDLTQKIGAASSDGVPFDKYAKATESLLNPSSVARAIEAGAPFVERVDVLIQCIGQTFGVSNSEIDEIVQIIDERLGYNDQRTR